MICILLTGQTSKEGAFLNSAADHWKCHSGSGGMIHSPNYEIQQPVLLTLNGVRYNRSHYLR